MSALTAVEVRVFECPSCGQTINTSMAQCPYCSAAVDPVAAVVAAELTSKVSQACSDASYVRIVAGTIVVFFLLFLVPFLGIVGLAGYYVLLVLVPILVGRWLLKYATLRTRTAILCGRKETCSSRWRCGLRFCCSPPSGSP